MFVLFSKTITLRKNLPTVSFFDHNLSSMRLVQIMKTIIPAMFLSIYSCVDFDQETDLGLSDGEYDIAIPLVNSKVTIGKIAEESKSNAGIKLDADGKATVVYYGEVLRKTSDAIFPPYPGAIPYPILDTLTNVKLLSGDKYFVNKAVFKDTKIRFEGESNLTQDVKVKMRILELSKGNQKFETDFTIKYNQALPSKFKTPEISIDGWTINTSTNSMTFQYEAIAADGSRIKLDQALMYFDQIKFSYAQGYLGYHEFPIDGNIIDVSLFDKWLSGSFDFENPKITLSVDNAFGIPVRSKVNKMELTSITGKTVSLQSPFVTSGIDFAYPNFSEVGLLKTTYFYFDRNNSNIREIFNEKTKTISYNISALINPERDTSIKGFITGDSYFVVNVAAEVPLHGSVNQVVITDTLDIDLGDIHQVKSGEFKAITSNDFPAEVKVQVYFLDDAGKPIEKLFGNEGIYLPAANILANGKTSPGVEKTDYIAFDNTKIKNIENSKKIAVVGYINTTNSDQKRSLWIYDSYGIGIKLGAKLKVKK